MVKRQEDVEGRGDWIGEHKRTDNLEKSHPLPTELTLTYFGGYTITIFFFFFFWVASIGTYLFKITFIGFLKKLF